MAKISAKGAVITIAGTDLSTYFESYEIEWAVDVVEATGFGDGWKNSIPGQKIVSITLNPYWEKTASTGVLAKLMTLMGTPATCSIVPEAGGQTISGTFFADGVRVQGQSAGGAIKLGAVKLIASGSAVATFS